VHHSANPTLNTHLSLLIVGSLPDPAAPESTGGTTVLLRVLLDYLSTHRIPHGQVRANRFFGRGASIKNMLTTLWAVIKDIRKYDYVLVNCSQNGSLYLAPLVFFVSRLARRKMAFRAFGGDLRENLENALPWVRLLFENTVIRSELIFVETKALVAYFEASYGCRHVLWFPNSRVRALHTRIRPYGRRFVFISHVKRTKGILYLIDAAKSLNSSYVIDVFGPMMEGDISAGDFSGVIRYCGHLPPAKVIETLDQYDVLVLPTFFEGEGYPGIILEAYSLGIPCITTKWKSIPEIVDDGESGILISPHSTPELIYAMKAIDESLYAHLCRGARAKFDEFDQEHVNANFVSSFQSERSCACAE
jgi:glycosyltransferase involved in cell wall biosynthesis